ncbi:hypothetical protein SAMN05216553_12448 [Lentzea fradiae]|uniref:Uncharacterized protein n=1 Tax=Lentzea fradiae TaxID=200378 RepID=A0A1G8CU71_9PSEU|nr:hypothetical protein [Lentzea fradiae]SDH49067.1 hypothetical protein SAMN05216553_12448 [Lentzea fradiae]
MGEKRLVLVLDYPGRRAESRVADLGLESFGFEVRALLTEPFPREYDAARYAAELVRRHGPFEDVAAVLAYCMAAPIAQEVAASCGAPVPLVLFDGEPSTPQAIAEQYRVGLAQVREQFGGAATAGELPLPYRDEDLLPDPAGCVSKMRQSFVDLATEALRLDGEDEDTAEIAEQIADFYVDWLTHLVAAHNATRPRWGGAVFHVVSREHSMRGHWPGSTDTTVVAVDSTRNELLSHPDTRTAVLDHLGVADRASAAVLAGDEMKEAQR